MGKVKVKINSYVENKNEQGECGAYGAVAVVNLWLDDKQLLKEVPVQTCLTQPTYDITYDAKDITFLDEEGDFSIMFGGNVDYNYKYYSFHAKTKSPEGFLLPITKGTVFGRAQNTYE
jgi:hypothetical protein